jgi:hypothetical protein
MQATPRVHPVATFALLVACPLLSGAFFGGIALGLVAAVGAHHGLAIGAVIGVAVFVINAAALCMAVNRGEDDKRTFAFVASNAAVAPQAHARAS